MLTVDGRTVVTWDRLGRTCILSGSDVDRADARQAGGLEGQGHRSLLGGRLPEPARDLLPAAIEAAHHGSLRETECTGRLRVGEPDDVDGDDHVPEVVGERSHGLEDLLRFECGPGRVETRSSTGSNPSAIA